MTAEQVRAAAERALDAGCFFVARPSRLRVEHVGSEEVRFEVYRGHLLDPAHARRTATFESWHVFLDDQDELAAAPLVSIRWDEAAGHLYVTRQILTRGFEAYEDSPSVIMSRPAQKWVAELVGTMSTERVLLAELPAELTTYLFLAVVGASRLPITSLESPLPAFSLGQLAYLPDVSPSSQSWTDAIRFFATALDGHHAEARVAKSLETALRSIPAETVSELSGAFAERIASGRLNPGRIEALLRTLFNQVALSPYTQFADRLNALLLALTADACLGPAAVVDAYSYMLRHLCRHLTAFDLTVFHNFGANYPDALFLDGLLQAYLRLIGEHAELFLDQSGETAATTRAKRRRRRALRQACLLRKQYEGHRVPDAPTSMGENARVLPPPFPRVPEEQILQTGKRRRTLFENHPLENVLGDVGRQVLAVSLIDLDSASELGELGMAQFLDRPLGVLKQPGEVDRTPLLSYEALSRSIVVRRIGQLHAAGWMTAEQRDRLTIAAAELPVSGWQASDILAVERAGVVSLSDAKKSAADFVLLRTTRSSAGELVARFDWRPLEEMFPEIAAWLASAEPSLWIQNVPETGSIVPATIRVYDQTGEPRLELGFDTGPQGPAFKEHGGVELPTRLQVLRVWSAAAGAGTASQAVAAPAVWIAAR